MLDEGLSQRDKGPLWYQALTGTGVSAEESIASPSVNRSYIQGQSSMTLPPAEDLAAHEYNSKDSSGAVLSCPKCNKEFRRKDNLRVHMRNKHKIGDQIVCRYCGMSFRSYLRLNEHTKLCEMSKGSVMPRFIQNH